MTVTTTVTPYTYEELSQFDYYSVENDADFYRWGSHVEVVISNKETVLFDEGEDGVKLTLSAKESFQTKDSLTLGVEIGAIEKLEVSDEYGYNVSRGFSESFSVSDSYTQAVTIGTRQFLSVIDADERLPSTVFFDLELDDYSVADENFEEYIVSKTPIHYSPIRQLIPGEYEYQNAIVGIQMNLPPTEGRFGIIGSTLHVDVQDVVEKGTSIVGVEGVTVTLTKKFYKELKIFATLVESEEPAIVEQSGVSLTGFTLKLKAISDPSRAVNGTVDWLVDGY